MPDHHDSSRLRIIAAALMLVIWGGGFLLTHSGYAASLAIFTFDGAAGNETTFAAEITPTHGAISPINRGAGLNPAAAGGAFSASGWSTTGLASDDYYAFTIQPDSGYDMTLTRLTLDERRSATGIRNWSVRSSLDGFTSDLALFSVPDDTNTRAAQSIPLDVSFAHLTTPVKFRIYGYNAAANAGTWRIDNLIIEGDITALTADTPPTVVSTFPAHNATNIPLDAALTLDFSEPVTPTGNWFTLGCAASGAHTASVSGGPQSYTLTPETSFAPGETCAVTILAAQVADQDGTPNNMAADYNFSFTTAPPISEWVINEINADPAGDANGDGTVSSTQDEFVEIVNNTGLAADISGWTLSDNTGVRHTFPANTIIPNQCAIVVFGGGNPTGDFGGAIIQTAGTLGLNNDGDTLTLSDSIAQATYTYAGEGNDNQSLTRNPDLTGPNPLVKHSTTPGSAGRIFSPGTKIDGAWFPGCITPAAPPTVASTIPLSGATRIAIDAVLTLNFSEPVTPTGDWLTIDCATSSAHTVVVSGGPQSYILTPVTDFVYNETCAVTVHADQITDQDGPPDPMAADYTFTFSTTPVILISEFLYDGLTASTEGDEFIEICNPNPAPVDLTGYKVGDEETPGGGESMYQLPASATLSPQACLVVAKNAAQFRARFGFDPDFEVIVSGNSYSDTPTAPNLTKYTAWGRGSWALANDGDELLVVGPNDEILDSVAYRNGDYVTLNLEPDASAPAPDSLQRVWPIDTDSMPHDFVRAAPNPGVLTLPPSPPAAPPPPADLPDGMHAYWGDLHAHTSFSDGAGPPYYALALARAAGLHFQAITDHAEWLTPLEWSEIFTQTGLASMPDEFVALRGFEWTGKAGHINFFNTDTLLRRDDPQMDTLPEIYAWLAANPAAIAQFNHPDPAYDGDFDHFAFNPNAAPQVFMQEIGNNAQGYVTYEPGFVQANMVGWQVALTNNSDTHAANWGAHPARTGLVAPGLTESDLLAAMRARRTFATEDNNLALALRLNGVWMGSVITTTGSLPLVVDMVDPDPEPLTLFVYDGNLLVAAAPLASSTGQWTGTVNAQPGHYFWAKVVQADGQTAYSAPVWIAGKMQPESLVINEILPAPHDVDWDDNGVADYHDEWVELFNPLDRPVGLGGWRLSDSSGLAYNIPLTVTIPAQGFALFFKAQAGFSLNNDQETVTLTHPNGAVVDTFTYAHSPGYDETWCRLPDGAAHWSENCGPSPRASNWEIPPAGPLKVTIFEAKRLTLGAWVKIKGRVTAPPGLLGARTMYIQDDTSGIMIYLPKYYENYNLGDKVEVVGDLRKFHEEFEVAVGERSDIEFLEAGLPPPPLPIATTSLLEPYEGLLVLLQGQTVNFEGRLTFWVDDGTDPAKVYLRRSTGIKKPFINRGTPISVMGIVSQYSEEDELSRDDYRLLPRYQTDLILPPPLPANWPILLPETGY